MVLRERPVRRAISRVDSCYLRAQRLMTLSVATSVTPGLLLLKKAPGWGRYVGQVWMEINRVDRLLLADSTPGTKCHKEVGRATAEAHWTLT